MEPNKNKVPKEMPNNFNSTTKKKEGGLSNSSESKGDPNTSSKNLLKDLAKKFNSPNEENTIKDPKKSKNANPSTAKEKTFYQFISGILSDDKPQLEKILKACQSHAMVNRLSIEGLTPIQYAALFGSISAFDYLISLKAQTDKEVEGLHLIHLSLSRAIFKREQKKCLNMFNHIYKKLPEQRKYVDRLGRTFLHLIFEYDFQDALEKIDINLDDLFQEDYNGDYVINYIYIYNANNCFIQVAKDYKLLGEIYCMTRKKYEENKGGKYILKEKFLENLFLRQNFYAIGMLIINSLYFQKELMEDLESLNRYYSQIEKTQGEIEQNGIISMKENIKYAINILKKNKNNQPQFKFPRKFQKKTGIIYNTNCIKHIKLPDDTVKHLTTRLEMFENSDRLACLIDGESGVILNDQIFHYGKDTKNEYTGNPEVAFHESKRKACLNDILKCHDIKYIRNLKNLCEKINQNKKRNNTNDEIKNLNNNTNNNENVDDINCNLNCLNSNPVIISEMQKTQKSEDSLFNYQKIDCDTYINEYSYENIYNTTGCVFDAIDFVMNKTIQNAFVLIRPPGHHAGFYGPVENPVVTSAGFCIVNNVAIGAAYLKNTYRDKIKKIAIVDFDVHHGNGTEEIIQMLNYKKFSKSFQYEKNGFFTVEDIKQINWLDFDDAKNILFISTHIYDKANEKKFYPYSGGTETNTEKQSPLYPGGILNIPFGFKNNLPYEYRNVFRSKVIPRLCKFKPDFIFISAGFDGHENESINQHHMSLNEFDFAFITEQIQFVANKYAEGRVVSVLEGGYNVSTGLISSFAQSALTHARFMNSSVNMYQCFDVKLTGIKRKYELEDEMNIYNKNNKVKNKPRRSERIKHHDDDYKKDDYGF
jgi:acetoin utilization deacetylase AcuC-like enzyme